MKAASFRKQVDNLRKTAESKADKWQGADGSNMKKVMYKVSAFFQFDLNAWSSVTLLDSATSIYVFNIKKDFQNSRKISKVKASYTAATLSLLRDGDKSYYP